MSFLSKFGSVFKAIFAGAKKVEQAVELPIETLFPATVPIFNVFDRGVEIAKDVEAAFAAAGVEKGGAQKLAAFLPGFSDALDEYTRDKFPGSEAILKAEAYLSSKTALANAIVGYLNSLPESLTVQPTQSALIAAAAAAAATNAKN